MGVMGKRVSQIDTKCNGDMFLDLFRFKPKNLSNISPNNIQGCQLNEGQWGATGSIVTWTYRIEGKPQVSKQVLEAIDEKNKTITFREFEGDLMQIYKSLKWGFRIEPNDESSLVAWTVEYEKINEDMPDPDVLLDFAYKITKDVEASQL